MRQVAAAGLLDFVAAGGEGLDLGLGHPDFDAARDDADGRGDGALGAHGLLAAQGGFQIVRMGQARRDDGGFERHHGARFAHRDRDPGLDLEEFGEGAVLRRAHAASLPV